MKVVGSIPGQGTYKKQPMNVWMGGEKSLSLINKFKKLKNNKKDK